MAGTRRSCCERSRAIASSDPGPQGAEGRIQGLRGEVMSRVVHESQVVVLAFGMCRFLHSWAESCWKAQPRTQAGRCLLGPVSWDAISEKHSLALLFLGNALRPQVSYFSAP